MNAITALHESGYILLEHAVAAQLLHDVHVQAAHM